jgi:hypothetical protein
MITSFEDFCTWMYVIIDDLWQEIAPLFKRPGPAPTSGSDSEVLTMALVGECRGWDQETTLIANWRAYRHLFPDQPDRTRFNRRRRDLMLGINLLRQVTLGLLDVAQDRQCAIDALPRPVAKIHLAPAAAEWAEHGAAYGTVSAKKQKIYGYKLHLLVTLGGVILDFELVPAKVADVAAGEDLLGAWMDLTALGDKGFLSASLKQQLWAACRVRLYTLTRRNQRQRETPAMRRLHNHFRQIIETVNGQLAEQFHIEENEAHTLRGLCARLYTKLTAHTLCLSLNRRLGNPDWLQIKPLAFAI